VKLAIKQLCLKIYKKQRKGRIFLSKTESRREQAVKSNNYREVNLEDCQWCDHKCQTFYKYKKKQGEERKKIKIMCKK
jgi:hypothetical protein